MRNTVYQMLSKDKRVIFSLMLVYVLAYTIFPVIPIFGAFFSTFHIIGTVHVLVYLWSSGWKASVLGLHGKKWFLSISYAILYAVWLYLIIDVLVQPTMEYYLGRLNFENYSALRGDLHKSVLTALFLVVKSGIILELFLHGYFMRRLIAIWGRKRNYITIAILIVTAMFMLTKLQSDESQIVIIGIGFGLLSSIYSFNIDNLKVVMMTTAVYNLFAIFALYYGVEHIMSSWIIHNFFGG